MLDVSTIIAKASQAGNVTNATTTTSMTNTTAVPPFGDLMTAFAIASVVMSAVAVGLTVLLILRKRRKV
ncbi:MAG: hypothetical protein RXR13_01650 [Sulfolobaceae archaeon]|jgi:hypothetical protein|nr:hypothetical protein [Sulfolobales archaeon]MCG2883677.1 hypothetical protein [Sulfolobales archaeon]MCG2908319.1 hypothetical protein [Sulfolobales archaeon]MCQ4336706.1 hypothetical protein [Sulfolobales archaeon]MCQ4406739.1 hypothetical protein [Sulfolobales archaeon]